MKKIIVIFQILLGITLYASDPDLFIKGKDYYKNKQYESAFDCFEKVVNQYPEIAKYHYNYGLAARKLRKYEIAYKAFLKAKELDPEISFTDNKSDFYDKIEEMKMNSSQDTPEYKYSKGTEYYENKYYNEAYNIFKSLTELDNKNAKYHYSLGLTCRKLNRYREALLHLEYAKSLDPSISFTSKPKDFYEKIEEMKRLSDFNSETDKKKEIKVTNKSKNKSIFAIMIFGIISVFLFIFNFFKRKITGNTTHSHQNISNQKINSTGVHSSPYDDYDRRNINNNHIIDNSSRNYYDRS